LWGKGQIRNTNGKEEWREERRRRQKNTNQEKDERKKMSKQLGWRQAWSNYWPRAAGKRGNVHRARSRGDFDARIPTIRFSGLERRTIRATFNELHKPP
jgi:hypothetical protein